MREITKYLAEGMEAKHLLIQRNAQLSLCDSIIKQDSLIILDVKEVNDTYKVYTANLISDNKTLCNDKNKEVKRKKIWRGLALGQIPLVAILSFIILL